MGRRSEKNEFRKWFQCITPTAGWTDKVAVPAGVTAATVATADGLRTVFLNEFLKQGYARDQPSKLWKRRWGNNEPGVECYYEVMNPCRLVDPQMAEAKKLKYVFNGMKPTLTEKEWVMQPKTCEEFLTAVRLHS